MSEILKENFVTLMYAIEASFTPSVSDAYRQKFRAAITLLEKKAVIEDTQKEAGFIEDFIVEDIYLAHPEVRTLAFLRAFEAYLKNVYTSSAFQESVEAANSPQQTKF